MLQTLADSNTTQYWCHPHHLHSTGNSWQQIFGGVFLSHATNLAQVRAWVVNYDASADGLSLLPEFVNEVLLTYGIELNTTVPGVLTLKGPNRPGLAQEFFGSPINYNTSYVSNDVWAPLLQMLAYRILPDAYDCDDYVGTTKKFGLQVVDRHGRKSNVFYANMVIATASVLFTNVDPVSVTDDISGDMLVGAGDLTKINFGPLRLGLNISWDGNLQSR